MTEPLEGRRHWTKVPLNPTVFSGRARKQGRRNRGYRNFSEFVEEEAQQQERLRVDADKSNTEESNEYGLQSQISTDKIEEVLPQVVAACDTGNSTSEESITALLPIDASLLAGVAHKEDSSRKDSTISSYDDLDVTTEALPGDISIARPEDPLLVTDHELKPRPVEDKAFDDNISISLDKLEITGLDESQEKTDVGTETDPCPISAGSGPLRGLGGFPAQQPQQTRNAPLGSGRLQNTNKISNSMNWGFGAPVNGAPGLPSAQTRQNATNNFSQTIGGSQPATPLDLSEFPSLSGASQTQYQNPGQAVWANANQRAVQNAPVQRPQQHLQANTQASTQQQQLMSNIPTSPQQSNDDIFPASAQFARGHDASSQVSRGSEDYRQGNLGNVGQLSGSSQPQPSNIEEFPPLGRNGLGNIGQDARSSMMQNAAFSDYVNENAFTSRRQALPNVSTSHSENTRSPSVIDRIMSPTVLGPRILPTIRSPFESMHSRQPGQTGSENEERGQMKSVRESQRPFESLFGYFEDPTRGMRNTASSTDGQAESSRAQQLPVGAQGIDHFDSSNTTQQPDRTPLSQMSDIDKWGLKGLLAKINSDDPNVVALAIGQDLSELGLDLNSPEPLLPTFAGPFTAPGSRPPLQPEFTLPACYTVENVHDVYSKAQGFSDETLLYIFYTQVRDVIQEVVATELTHRNWRYHKVHRMWLTKDANLGDPVRVNDQAERGNYVFFDPTSWQRVRQPDFILYYKDLDDHIQVRPNVAGLG